MIRFTCPKCRVALSAPKGFEGRTSTCRNCKQAVLVPRGAMVLTGVPKPPSQPGIAPQDYQHRTSVFHTYLGAAKWAALSSAMLLSLVAALLPLAGFGGPLSYAVAGFAIVAGLAAVGIVIAARRTMLEGAAIAVFLSLAGLVFTINLAVTESKSNAAADAMAKAAAKENDLRPEGEKTATEQQSAAAMLQAAKELAAKAEAAQEKAHEAEGRAAAQTLKGNQLLEQVKAEQAQLDNKRDELAKQTANLAAERANLKSEPSPKTDPPIRKDKTPPAKVIHWVDASKDAIQLGDVKVRVTAVWTTNAVVGNDAAGSVTYYGTYLLIDLNVANLSEAHKYRFVGWGARDGRSVMVFD
jgi:multidrug efflux pump subunit AcrA (membrane-fusion protein)